MGLFDGAAARGQSGSGTTADLASLLGWPVVLVLDVTGQTETAAAVALGCARYRDDIDIAGVILNRVASARHLALIAPAFERIALPVFGAILRDEGIALPERHLGLVQAREIADIDQHLDKLADVVDAAVDIDAIRRSARPAKVLPPASDERSNESKHPLPPPGQRIALAQDPAFSFMYPHLLRQWRHAGAEIIPFSPLADEAPDATADAVWLPGGYPELHAGTLASANVFRAGLRTSGRTLRAHPRRVRWLHGAGARDRGCRRREARDDRAARARNFLCAGASCIWAIAAPGSSATVRSARRARKCSAMNTIMRARFRSMAIRWSIAGTLPERACPNKASGMARRRERFFMSSTGRPPHDRDAALIAATIRRDVSRDVPRPHALASRRPPLSPRSRSIPH